MTAVLLAPAWEDSEHRAATKAEAQTRDRNGWRQHSKPDSKASPFLLNMQSFTAAQGSNSSPPFVPSLRKWKINSHLMECHGT